MVRFLIPHHLFCPGRSSILSFLSLLDTLDTVQHQNRHFDHDRGRSPSLELRHVEVGHGEVLFSEWVDVGRELGEDAGLAGHALFGDGFEAAEEVGFWGEFE